MNLNVFFFKKHKFAQKVEDLISAMKSKSKQSMIFGL